MAARAARRGAQAGATDAAIEALAKQLARQQKTDVASRAKALHAVRRLTDIVQELAATVEALERRVAPRDGGSADGMVA